MSTPALYANKPDLYFTHVRHDLLALIPAGTCRLLDVGCGTGATGWAAKQTLGVAEVWGIEVLAPVAAVARTTLDHLIVGDVETCDLACSEGYFDCIVCADVLEHLRDPWGVLRKLHRALAGTGVLVASLPNLRHLVPLLKIVRDRFEYEPEGIVDQTHLRFFTLHTIRQMFTQTGYLIEHVAANRSRGWKWTLLNVCSLGLLRPFTISQYLLVAKKRGS